MSNTPSPSSSFNSILLGQSILSITGSNLYINGNSASTSQSNVVTTTGAQFISGIKTFTNEIVAPGGISGSNVISSSLSNSSLTEVLDLDGKQLIGSWQLNGNSISSNWATINSLSAVTADVPATPATLNINISDWGNSQDGDTVTFTDVSGSVQIFFRIIPIGGTDVQAGAGASATASAIVEIINTNLTNSNSTYDGTVTLTITSNATGSGQTESVSGTVNSSGVSGSASGTDDIPGTGTPITSIVGVAGGSTAYVAQILVSVGGGASWSVCDIEIGYYDGATFTRTLLIPLAFLVASALLVYPVNINFGNVSDMSTFHNGIASTAIYARTAVAGSPANETTGSVATIYAKGYII